MVQVVRLGETGEVWIIQATQKQHQDRGADIIITGIEIIIVLINIAFDVLKAPNLQRHHIFSFKNVTVG